MSSTIQIVVNGERREVAEGLTVADWVERAGFHANQVAVEVNRELVPRSDRDRVTLSDGDRVELVTLVGGG